MPNYYLNQAVGSRSRLIIGEETTYGTSPASTGWAILPFVSESFQTERDALISETITGTRRVDNAVISNERIQGDIVMEVMVNKPFTTMMSHLLGEYDEDGVQTSIIGGSTGGDPAYRHTLKGSVELPTASGVGPVALSLEKQFLDIDQYFRFTACRINTLRLEFPSTGFIRATWSMAGTASVAPSSTPTDPTPTAVTADTGRTPMTTFQALVYEGSTISSSNGYSGNPSGSAIGYLKSANIEISNNLGLDNYVVGQSTRANLLPGRRRVSGTAEFLFLDRTLYNKFVNNDDSSLVLDINRSGTNELMRVYLPRIKYIGGSPTPTIPNDGPINITLPFQAVDSSADDTEIITVFKNEESTIRL